MKCHTIKINKMRNNKEYLTIGIGWIGIFIMLLILICTSNCTKKNNTITNTNNTNTPITYTDWNGIFHEVNTPSDQFSLTKVSGSNNYLITSCWQWNSYCHSCYTNDYINENNISSGIIYQCNSYNVKFQGNSSLYDTLFLYSNNIKYKYIR